MTSNLREARSDEKEQNAAFNSPRAVALHSHRKGLGMGFGIKGQP